MHELISFNNIICRSAEAQISAVSSAALYGKGVFTTLAIYHGLPFLWDEHFLRLQNHAVKTGLNLEVDKLRLETALRELIAANNCRDGRARITIFDNSASRLWQTPENPPAEESVLITTADVHVNRADWKLGVSPFRVNTSSPLAGVKSTNYLENLLAAEEAKLRGFDEAVRLNERGEIAAGCLSNIFWIADGKIFTPPLATGALNGTMRNFVIKTAAESGFEVVEKISELGGIRKADAVFMTSAGIGVKRVSRFEQRTLAINETFKLLTSKIEKGLSE